MRVSIIGFGNMAKAIAHGLLRDTSIHLQVTSPSLTIGINRDGIRTHHDNQAVIPQADVIVLAVKPSQMETVLIEIAPLISAHQLVISIAAGLTCHWFKQFLPDHMALIRAMPNLAAMCGQSATPLVANAWVKSKQRTMAERIFLTSGIVTWTNQESDLDAFTALSGSGPAYLFLWMSAMVKAAVKLGLPEDIATAFAIQTAQGAATLAATQDKTLAALQQAVTSKGGTTAAALKVFQDKQIDDIVLEAMTAAYQRSQELAKCDV